MGSLLFSTRAAIIYYEERHTRISQRKRKLRGGWIEIAVAEESCSHKKKKEGEKCLHFSLNRKRGTLGDLENCILEQHTEYYHISISPVEKVTAWLSELFPAAFHASQHYILLSLGVVFSNVLLLLVGFFPLW